MDIAGAENIQLLGAGLGQHLEVGALIHNVGQGRARPIISEGALIGGFGGPQGSLQRSFHDGRRAAGAQGHSGGVIRFDRSFRWERLRCVV